MKYDYVLDQIMITTNKDVSEEEIHNYIHYVKEKNHGKTIQSLSLEFSGEEVGVGYTLAPQHFEKIRRITGYLVGDMSRWNDGKSAEEADRVKHA